MHFSRAQSLLRILNLGIVHLVTAVAWGAVVFSSVAVAQSELDKNNVDTATLLGLTFPCANCRVTPSGSCEVSVRGNRIILPCDQAVDLLVESLLESKQAVSFPTAAEIRRFLHQSAVSQDRAGRLLILLGRTEQAQSILQDDAAKYSELYPEGLSALLASGYDDPQVLLALWKVPPNTKATEKTDTLRALIALKHPDLGFEALLEELSALDTKRDWEILLSTEAIFRRFNSPQLGHVTDVLETFRSCRRAFNEQAMPERCSSEALQKQPSGTRNYFERLKIQLAIDRVEHGSSQPGDVFSLIELTNYPKYRTPRLHQLVRQALQELTADSPFVVETILANHGKLLDFFAKNDGDISAELGRAYSEAASQAINRGAGAVGLSLLEKSVAVYPAPLQLRANFVAVLMQKSVVSLSDSERDRLERLAERIGVKKKIPLQVSLLIVLCVVVLIAFWLVVLRLRKREDLSEAEEAQKLQLIRLDEIGELRTLCEFFGLADQATEEDLTREYRARAKASHPDTGVGNHDEFVALQTKYERARELMAKYSAAPEEQQDSANVKGEPLNSVEDPTGNK